MLILTLFPALIMACCSTTTMASNVYNLRNSKFEELPGRPFQAALTRVLLNNTHSQEYRCFYKPLSDKLLLMYHHENQTNSSSWSIQCGMAAFVIAAFSLNILISYKNLKRSTAILNQMKMAKSKKEPFSTHVSLLPNEN